jgi:hypothetical protein
MSLGTCAIGVATLGLGAALVAAVSARSAQPEVPRPASSAAHHARADQTVFATSHDCVACHNNLVGPSGEDLSIGASWRGSMMANSARDPYVIASVRRETLDHPSSAAAIEDECAACHLPAARQIAHASGTRSQVFAHLAGPGESVGALARDGVTCTVCHQIAAERLGTAESFNGNFAIAPPLASGRRRAFGPFTVDAGRRRIMHSATGFEQERADHIRQSELCATCHTLVTEAIGSDGRPIGSLPEQMNYQEWRHSAFVAEGRGCQSCHMPRVAGPVRVSSVLGEFRDGLSRHTFLGGNAFMLRMLQRYRQQLAVEATPAELEAVARATERQLENETATLAIERLTSTAGALTIDVSVRNLTGHKFPTGYPSRRAWLHVTVKDAQGRALFESGRVSEQGSIEGNDADIDPDAFEPHYTRITQPADVQIYESIMGTPAGRPTTGLLQATRYLKDNRLLPRGFDKRTADASIGVIGGAAGDADFGDGGDRVQYHVAAVGAATVEVALRYQPIAYRWAQNLKQYDAREPRTFVTYFESLAASSSVLVTRVSRPVDGR